MWKVAVSLVCEYHCKSYGYDYMADIYSNLIATEVRIAGGPEYVFNGYVFFYRW